MFAATIPVGDAEALVSLFGTRDQHLRQIREALEVEVSERDGQIELRGEEPAVVAATQVFEHIKGVVARRGSIDAQEVRETIQRVQGNGAADFPAIDIQQAGRKIRPRTPGQAQFVEGIRKHDMTFCTGPAGTGKTFLAVAMAVEALRLEQMRKIVLVRPAVEAGESLGFLPGDLQAKINPYLRPLLDALREMLDYDLIRRYTAEDVIEMIPLAYMRGRTLNGAFIILDEAQNTTVPQMKMFLTRMGLGSKVVVSGDTTQVDLPPHTRSGLTDALSRLKNIPGFCSVHLTKSDIVRHRLVQDIVRAYEEAPKKRRG